jgi:hypothetical protein
MLDVRCWTVIFFLKNRATCLSHAIKISVGLLRLFCRKIKKGKNGGTDLAPHVEIIHPIVRHPCEGRDPENTGCRIENGMTGFGYLVAKPIL